MMDGIIITLIVINITNQRATIRGEQNILQRKYIIELNGLKYSKEEVLDC